MMQRPLLWLALLGTLAACWWVDQQETAGVQLVATASKPPARRPQAEATSPVPVPMSTIQAVPTIQAAPSSDTDTAVTDLFAAWQPVAAATVAASPVPTHPFTVNGRLLHDGQWQLFLTDGQQQYVVQAESHFADGWQVSQLDSQHVRLQHGKTQFEIRLDDGE